MRPEVSGTDHGEGLRALAVIAYQARPGVEATRRASMARFAA